jgi:hypothetical protein
MPEGATVGASTGGVVGGTIGLLAGIGALAAFTVINLPKHMKMRLLIAFLGLVSSFTDNTTGDRRTSTWQPANEEGIGSDYDSVYQATGVRPVIP